MSASSAAPSYLSATGGSDTLPGRDQRPALPRRLPAPPRDPDALEGQRRLRPRQQRRVLLVLRHGHQRVADRGGRARHPSRPGDRAVRRVALRLPRAARLSRDGAGGAAGGARRALERALRDRPVRRRRRRRAARGDRLVRPRLRRSRRAAVGRDPRADAFRTGAAAGRVSGPADGHIDGVSQQDRLVADRFRLIRRLGAGAMASVFLAEDCELGRRVAIKRLHPEASASEIAPRFRREMRVAASLSHPNVGTLYDAIEDDGDVLLIMELVDGPTLAQLMREGPIEPGEAVRILRAIASAVDHLHARGIIHRDVKPANILIDRAGEAKLTDLGIASAAEATGITTSGTVLGTPAYMAPELFDGERATAAADVYSIAAIAFEMLSGRRARGGGTPAVIAMRAATEPPPDLRELWPDAGPLADVLERGMARDPAQRPESATALVEAIEDALRERDLPPTEVRAAVGPPAPAPQGTAEVPVERRAARRPERDGAAAAPAASEPMPGARPRRERRAPAILLLGAAALALAAVAAVLIAGRGGSGSDRRSASTPSTSTSSDSTTKKKRSSGSSSTTTRSTAPSTGSTARSSTGSTAQSSTGSTAQSPAQSTGSPAPPAPAPRAPPRTPARAVLDRLARAVLDRLDRAVARAVDRLDGAAGLGRRRRAEHPCRRRPGVLRPRRRSPLRQRVVARGTEPPQPARRIRRVPEPVLYGALDRVLTGEHDPPQCERRDRRDRDDHDAHRPRRPLRRHGRHRAGLGRRLGRDACLRLLLTHAGQQAD